MALLANDLSMTLTSRYKLDLERMRCMKETRFECIRLHAQLAISTNLKRLQNSNNDAPLCSLSQMHTCTDTSSCPISIMVSPSMVCTRYTVKRQLRVAQKSFRIICRWIFVLCCVIVQRVDRDDYRGSVRYKHVIIPLIS